MALLLMATSIAAARLEGPTVFAILALLVPGLAGLGLLARDGWRERVLLLGVWSLMAVAGSALSGGLAGPLAGFVFLPLAAGVLLGRHLARAGALGSGVAAVAGMVSLSMAGIGEPQPMLATVSGVLCAVAVTLAIGLVGRHRERRADRIEATAASTRVLLSRQPALTLVLEPSGRVAEAYGVAPAALPLDVLSTEGLIAAVHAPDRPQLLSAIEAALSHNTRRITVTPRLALDRRIDLILRRVDVGEGTVRIAALCLDATTRHAREMALEAARAEAEAQNAGKSRFLAHMSHELRTPLNAVIGFSDMMRQRIFGPLPERYADYAQSIHEAGGHLLALINDVLDVSKIEAERYELSLEPFDARDVVSSAIALVRVQATEKGVTLSGMLPGEALAVRADERALKQITLNLLSNAIKFTPSGGVVTATLETVKDQLELVVADTGVGIAADDLRRLGRPFEQAGGADQRALGTGLGLALVRSLAELHGGSMTMESTVGSGTAVTVRLPVLAVTQEALPKGGAEIIPIRRDATPA